MIFWIVTVASNCALISLTLIKVFVDYLFHVVIFFCFAEVNLLLFFTLFILLMRNINSLTKLRQLSWLPNSRTPVRKRKLKGFRVRMVFEIAWLQFGEMARRGVGRYYFLLIFVG